MPAEIIAVLMWLAVGVIVPFVSGFLLKQSWDGFFKVVIVGAVSAVLAFVFMLARGEVSLSDWSAFGWPEVAATFAASQLWFWIFVERTGLKQWLYDHGYKDGLTPALK